MDFQRLFLFLIFAFSLVLVWDGWQRYQHPELYVQQETTAGKAAGKAALPPVSGQTAIAQQVAQRPTGKVVQVKTDLFEAEISTVGGDIIRLALLKHPDAKDKNKPLVLFQRGEGTHNYVAQSGLLGAGLPNHNSLFTAEQDRYELTG